MCPADEKPLEFQSPERGEESSGSKSDNEAAGHLASAANRVTEASETLTVASETLTEASQDIKQGAQDLKKTATATRLLAERTFLNYQSQLRVGGSKLLNEAMLVLDIIDTKTTSLLQYISVSSAVMIFFWGIVLDPKLLDLSAGTRFYTSGVLILVIMLLLASIIICLSCLNIVGAHTIKNLSMEDYEATIIKVTNSRRNRYRIAHKMSFVTAIMSLGIFLTLFTLGALRIATLPPLPADVEKAAPAGTQFLE